MNRSFKLLLIGFTVLLASAVQIGAVMAKEDITPKMTIAGEGVITGKPDLVVVYLGVYTKKPTAKEALAENTAAMKALFEAVKSHGVEDKDIQTTRFNIWPIYKHVKRATGWISSTTKRVPDGYSVNNMATLKVRNFDHIGEILDKVVSVGANRVHNLQFQFSNEEELRQKARIEAVKQAKAKAEAYVGALGVKLGRVLSISEHFVRPVYRRSDLTQVQDHAKLSSAVPIERGETSLKMHVNVTFEILN